MQNHAYSSWSTDMTGRRFEQGTEDTKEAKRSYTYLETTCHRENRKVYNDRSDRSQEFQEPCI